ncbi:MAG: DUF5107 domain-containing protein, partial [Lachnospiraceae bacterium]|nr:DUF5107 domain-containing protein [Lachnospiraceae bacterium]
YNVRTLKTALLRHLGLRDDAVSFAKETLSIDPLEMGARFELAKLSENSDWTEIMRADNEDYRELSMIYMEAGLDAEAREILLACPNKNEPMTYYYLYHLTGEEEWLKKAEETDSLHCFPNRLMDVVVLSKAVSKDCPMAAYYLGCLYYDKGEWEKARSLWESVENRITLPTVHRNLSLVYYNKCQDVEKARNEMELAFKMDKEDARVFFELDQLYKVMELYYGDRLANMEENKALLTRRDDLYTEYISLLNRDGQYQLAYDLIMGHKFHPWEGGEGKITGEYRRALMGLASKCEDSDKGREKARTLLKQALNFPENLGEGKLIGELDNDIYWNLACLSDGAEKEEYLNLAARGENNFSSAMYYNDQPPEMMYYRALALNGLGRKDEAKAIGEAMVEYGKEHSADRVKIDYFAVSLPDFLIYEADLAKKNVKHCENMMRLGERILQGTI